MKLPIFGFGIRIGILALAICGTAAAQHSDHAPAPAKPATMVSGLGDLHHPVSTTHADAQQFFDQGLRYIFAFNHDEAARSFQRAAELDPTMAMAYWGMAEAIGPNYNDPASEDRFKQAHEAIAKAQSLAAKATASERGYIDATLNHCGGSREKAASMLGISMATLYRKVEPKSKK